MTPPDRTHWQRLSALLDVGLELNENERVAWLATVRASEPAIAEQIATLLAAEAGLDGRHILDSPLWGEHSDAGAGLAGQRVGAYTLETAIGHGGMGSVWRAHRSDGRFSGTVAFKFVNLALLDASGIARFQREGTMLGRLSHPNIARLLDAGVTDGGQPYLVLEHVDGVSIDEYCDRQRLSPEARIRLVLDVLAAVGHAHTNLIVHRDLKPSNILVTSEGVPKLLDFGIAKLMHDDANAASADALTDVGGRLLTPDYAAPEQITGDPITTATDVYSLGVLLFVLLTGRHPTRTGKPSTAEMLKSVVDTEPLRLAAAVTSQAGADAQTVATVRASTVDRLRRAYGGDLGNILARALRKRPDERYPSTAAFADDLQRYLRHEPVSARPDSLTYRASKFMRRNRVRVVIGALATIGLVVGSVREVQLRAKAEAETSKAVAVEEYLVSVFAAADPFALPTDTADVTARVLLARGAARVNTAFAEQPEVRAELRVALGRVYGNLGLHDQAVAQLSQALRERRLVFGARHEDVAEAMDALGKEMTATSRFAEADTLLREALAQRRDFLGDQHEATAESLENLTALRIEQDDLAAAEPMTREALAIRRVRNGRNSLEAAANLTRLSRILESRESFAEADTVGGEAVAIRERLLGPDHPFTAEAFSALAAVNKSLGRFDQAERLFRRSLAARQRSLGPNHPSVASASNDLADFLHTATSRTVEAESLFRAGLAINRRTFGEQHANVATNLSNVAVIVRERGDYAEAERLLLQALAIDRALYPGDHEFVGFDLNEIASVLRSHNRPDSAAVLLREALAMNQRLHGPTHRNTLAVQTHLGRALRESGRYADAERLLRSSVNALDPKNPEVRLLLIPAQVTLGRTLTALGRAGEAIPLLQPMLAETARDPGPAHWRAAEARMAMGESLFAVKRYAEAEAHLVAAYAVLDGARKAQPLLAPQGAQALARLYAATGRPGEARKYQQGTSVEAKRPR